MKTNYLQNHNSVIITCIEGDPCSGNECLNYKGGYACSPCKKGHIPIPTKILNSSLAGRKEQETFIPFYRNALISFEGYTKGLQMHFDYKCLPESCTIIKEFFMEGSGTVSITKKKLCNKNAHCVGGGSNAKCVCNKGYEGNGVKCTNINECLQNITCENPSTCIDMDPGYFCQCPKGWYGEKCDKSICRKNPCFYGGKCMLDHTTETGYRCLCPISRKGVNCTVETDKYTFRPRNLRYSGANFVMLSKGREVISDEGIIFKTQIKASNNDGSIFNIASQDGNAHNTFIGRSLEIRNSSLIVLLYSSILKEPFYCQLKTVDQISHKKWRNLYANITRSVIQIRLDDRMTECPLPETFLANFTKLDVTGGFGQPDYTGGNLHEEEGGIRDAARANEELIDLKPLAISFKGVLRGAQLNGQLIKLKNVYYGRPPIDDLKSFFYFRKLQGIEEGIVNDRLCDTYENFRCQNNGSCYVKNYNIISCACTPSFHGHRCSERKLCPNETIDGTNYPALKVGQLFQSSQKCSSNGTFYSKITRKCFIGIDGATWDPPFIIKDCVPFQPKSTVTNTLLQLSSNKLPANETVAVLTGIVMGTQNLTASDIKLGVNALESISFQEISEDTLKSSLNVVENLFKNTKTAEKVPKTVNYDTIKILDRLIIGTKIPSGRDSVTALTNDILLTKTKVNTIKKLSGFSISSNSEFSPDTDTRLRTV